MTTPSGSQESAGISTNSFQYLIGSAGDLLLTGSWNHNDWVHKGMPKYNYENTIVEEQLMVDIGKALPERSNVTTTIFQDYPELLQTITQTDITVGSTATDIWITFIDEGAGYSNAFGYYFYYIDGNGDKKLLENATNNSDDSLGYYKPTIIFPNASRKNGGYLRSNGSLIPGIKRKLRGNATNGTFQNIRVGFFLIPNGWKNSTEGIVYNNKEILHSTKEFNPNYQDINDPDNNGVQAILFDNGNSYMVCFEDIKRPDGDSDFNDLIIKMEISDSSGLTNVINFPGATKESKLLKYDYYGSYIYSPLSSYPNLSDNTKKYKFTRALNFTNKNKRDEYIALLSYIVHNLEYELRILNDNVIWIRFCYVKDDIDNNTVDQNTIIYTLRKEDNDDDEVVVDTDTGDTRYDKLVTLQHIENNNLTQQDNDIVEVTTDENKNETEATLSTESNVEPENITSTLMVWGDPYIRLLNGDKLTLGRDEGTFTYMDTGNMKINISIDLFKDHPMPGYREYSFIRYVSFNYRDEKIIIDMFNNLDLMEYDDNQVLKKIDTFKSDNIQVSDINEIDKVNYPKYVNLLSQEHEITVRIINVKGVSFWAIMYPRNLEYYNELYTSQREIIKLSDINGLVVDGVMKNHSINNL